LFVAFAIFGSFNLLSFFLNMSEIGLLVFYLYLVSP
jgi:hypothetical protein